MYCICFVGDEFSVFHLQRYLQISPVTDRDFQLCRGIRS